MNYSEKQRDLFFETVYKGIQVFDCLLNLENLTDAQINALKNSRLLLLKTLYIIPSNDDYQFNSIMRAMMESLLRLILSTQDEMETDQLFNTNFRKLNQKIKSLNIYAKHKQIIDKIFSFFGFFSNELHFKSGRPRQTFEYLIDIMVNPPYIDLNRKTNYIKEVWNLVSQCVIDVFPANTKSLEASTLSRLLELLGQEQYDEIFASPNKEILS
ncbi:hypothetical protein MOA93_14620 [Bacillus spizizenii]|nr:hypothetical protein [Bacillus spizizenii]